MATQRLSVALIAGDAATSVESLHSSWQASTHLDPLVVDAFAEKLRAKATSLPIVYFCEWIDRWLMGDLVPGPRCVAGHRFEVAFFTPEQAQRWADRCGHQHVEQVWLAARLREVSTAWDQISEYRAIVVIREVLGVSMGDDQIRAACHGLPEWLTIGNG